MRVKIILPHGADGSRLDERGWATLHDGATLYDACRLVRVNPIKAKLLLVSVNGERAPLDAALHDGDVIGFFSISTGG